MSSGPPAGYAEGSLWCYAPNKGVPIAFAVLFAASGIVHAYQCFRYKCWSVSGLLPWAAVYFTVGFIMREVGAYNYDNLGVFIASTALLLIAPPVYEGANYFLLGRVLYYVPYHAPLHPGRVVTTFIGLDTAIGALTGTGAAYVANTSLPESKQALGHGLLKAALILQLVAMTLFIGIAARFHYKCRRTGVLKSNLRTVIVVLYCSCTIITARTIYRTVEYFAVAQISTTSGGNISPIVCHEWFFWVFEASLMFSNSVLLNVFHPSRYLPRNNKIYLSEDGKTEIEGPGYKDKRNFLLTLFDPFDIIGLIRKKDAKRYCTHYRWEVDAMARE
ncbi:RTA1 like protein-domain-containing protein [Schizophyllum amplum]|uniref:RTA1 like protein-domain-containing protein n=1 Tax=Schizophyllum amplum TaxID=97359 RepID=A0A550CTU1_9AGAR|nr:RTA1 like protein-domain-containing protein [Auriculariopsis ampla]